MRADDLVWQCEKATTLEDFLCGHGISRNAFIDLYKGELLFVNGTKAKRGTKLQGGEEVRVRMTKEQLDYESIPMELDILFEDEDILVLNKPAGITVNSVGQTSLANGVAHYFKDHNIHRKVRFLNRLDMNTTGCIVIAKSGIAQRFYQQQIEEDHFEKWYEAIVEGTFEGEGLWELPMMKDEEGFGYKVSEGGKLTRTGYKTIKTGKDESLVEVRLYTGKTHQIRVAFAHAGHPLVGDELYGGRSREKGFALRAKRIVFTSMRTGERVEVVAE